jgi:indolepyruvate decarboxylase
MGLYSGALANENVRQFVESCDWVIGVGTLLSDFNTGAFTAKLSLEKTINIGHHSTRVGNKTYPNIEMNDILSLLATRLSARQNITAPSAHSLGPVRGQETDLITADNLYPRWANFIQPKDIVIAETGTSSLGLGFAHMPKGATFHNQSLWGSIGWATPAAFGAAVAAPNSRVILFTGEGSHQLTAQEISQFARRKLRPIIFVLNNNGYLIERLLCKDPAIIYNDLAQWNYASLPQALGCNDWFTARVTTCGELDKAMAVATKAKTGVYIEVITETYSAPPLANKLHENTKSLYST